MVLILRGEHYCFLVEGVQFRAPEAPTADIQIREGALGGG
jgi:hypothetical protein